MRRYLIFAVLFFAVLFTINTVYAKSTPPALPEPTTSSVKKRPTHVDEIDALRLGRLIALMERDNILREAAKREYEMADQRWKANEKEREALAIKLHEKYGIDPKRDSIDEKTFEILWAPPLKVEAKPEPKPEPPKAETRK